MSSIDKDNTENSEIKDIPFIPVVSFPPDEPSRLIRKAFLTIAITLALAGITAISYLFLYTPSEEGAAFKESQMGSAAALYNLLFLLGTVVVFSIILYIMIKKRLLNILTVIQALLLGFVGGSIIGYFLILWIYELLIILDTLVSLSFLYSYWDLIVSILNISIDVLFFVFWILISLAIVSPKFKKLRNFLLVLLSATTGAFLGLSLGIITPIILMLGFAIYDIFAVFKGPLKLITEELKNIVEEEGEESIQDKTGLLLGLGDLFFYSLAVGYSLAFLGWIPFLLVSIAIIAGSTYTIKLVIDSKRKKALPALPIPMFLALAVIIFFYFL